MNSKAKRITTIAMLCAISYAVMAVGRVPVVLFLKYDPKDVIITLGSLIWGPFTAFIVSVIVSFIEMFSVSDTGIIGCVMNILSTCAFACTASIEHRIAQHIAMDENSVKDIIYTVQRVSLAQERRSYDRMEMASVTLAGRQELDRHAHLFCIKHIFFRDLCDSFGVDILKIHLLS